MNDILKTWTLFSFACTMALIGCASKADSAKTTASSQAADEYREAEMNAQEAKMSQLYLLTQAKADGMTMDYSGLKDFDSAEVRSLILERQLEIKQKKVERELVMAEAGGTNQASVLNYKMRIVGIKKQRYDNQIKFPKLYLGHSEFEVK